MATHDAVELFRFPERVKDALLRSQGMMFGDSTEVSVEEMWEFLNLSAPERFPGAFTFDRYTGGISPDVDFLTGVKRYYFGFSSWDRLRARIVKGMPLIAVQAGTPIEIYQAAQCIAIGPGFPMGWMLSQEEGFDREENQRRISSARNECKKSMPTECCTIVGTFRAVHQTGCSVKLIAPVTMTACSDAVFAMESARRRENSLPAIIIDFPAHRTGSVAEVAYIADQFRALAVKLAEHSGVLVDDDLLREEIHRQNIIRHLARECNELWWNAEVPPTNSGDRLLWQGADDYNFPAVLQLMRENKAELKERIDNHVLGKGLIRRNPIRLFVCGSCAGLNAYMVEQVGGVIVGHEPGLSALYNDIPEDGDPFLRLAESLCASPYELPPAERGGWTAQKVREARADGVIFIYNWGCNYQSAVSRTVADVIREVAGVPVLVIDISQSGNLTNAEQMRTRVEAFMEILGHNRTRHVVDSKL